MNSLPASNSPQFSLNALDWKKIARFMAVQAVGAGLTLVPVALGYKYVYKGADYTPIVLMAVNGLAEAGRRFVASNQ